MKTAIVILALFCAGVFAQSPFPTEGPQTCLNRIISGLTFEGTPCLMYDELISDDTTLSESELDGLCAVLDNACTRLLDVQLQMECGLDVLPLLCSKDASGYCTQQLVRTQAVESLVGDVCAGECLADSAICDNALNNYGCCAYSIITLKNILTGVTDVEGCNLPNQCSSDFDPPTDMGPTNEPSGMDCLIENFDDLVTEIGATCTLTLQRIFDPTSDVTDAEMTVYCEGSCATDAHRFLVSRCQSNIMRAVCSKDANDDFCITRLASFISRIQDIAGNECSGPSISCSSSEACQNSIDNLTCCGDSIFSFAKFIGLPNILPADCSTMMCDIPPGLENGASPLTTLSFGLFVAMFMCAITAFV